MPWGPAIRVALVLSALLSLSACATHRVATAPARPAPAAPAPPAAPAVGYEETGEATWYGNPYHGRRAASGEIYDMNQMTAAHRTLPFGTRVRVQSLVDGSSVEVRINDRGPFKDTDKRILDLSYAAGRLLGVIGPGVIPIRLRVVSLPATVASATPPAAPPAASAAAPPAAPAAAPSAPPAPAVPAPPAPAPTVSPAEPAVSPSAQVAPPITPEKPEPRVAAVSSAEAAVRPPAPAPPAPVAVAPPPASAPITRATEGWSVQLAAYASEAPAVTLRDTLARSWPDARVLRAEIGGRAMWRVRVGNYATRREADEAVKRLAASGYRAMVVEAGRP